MSRFDPTGEEWMQQNYFTPVDARKINPYSQPHFIRMRIAAGPGSGFRIAHQAQLGSVRNNRAQSMVHPESIQGGPPQAVNLLTNSKINFIR